MKVEVKSCERAKANIGNVIVLNNGACLEVFKIDKKYILMDIRTAKLPLYFSSIEKINQVLDERKDLISNVYSNKNIKLILGGEQWKLKLKIIKS